MLKFGAGLLALAIALHTARPAAAQTKSALSWVREPGAESCIGAAELGQRVERLVGPMLVSAPDGQVSVEGRIARAEHGFVANIVIANADGAILGTRQLNSEPEDCHAIDEKLAFVIAVAIDPNAALAELPGELAEDEDPGAALLADLRAHPPQPVAPPPPVPPTPAAKRAATPSSARAQSFQLRAAFEPSLGFGNLPATSAGAALGAGVAFNGLALWLRVLGFVPQQRDARASAAVRITTLGLSAAVCPLALRSSGWEAWLCPGVGADLLLATPVGFDGTARQRLVFGPDLELRAGILLSSSVWLGLSGVLSNRFPRQRIGYDLDGSLQTVYRTPVVGGRAGAVLELRF